MAEWIDQERLGEPGLLAQYQQARPFPHLIVDDVLVPGALARLVEALEEEEADRMVDEIVQVDATADTFASAGMQRFLRELQSKEIRGWIKGLTGEASTHVRARGYAYGPGDYLLPHADADEDASRRVAFVLYVAAPALVGGELEWFETHTEGDDIVATTPAGRVAAVPGRLVLFAVGPHTLHQVREVEAGKRISVAGWFRR